MTNEKTNVINAADIFEKERELARLRRIKAYADYAVFLTFNLLHLTFLKRELYEMSDEDLQFYRENLSQVPLEIERLMTVKEAKEEVDLLEAELRGATLKAYKDESERLFLQIEKTRKFLKI